MSRIFNLHRAYQKSLRAILGTALLFLSTVCIAAQVDFTPFNIQHNSPQPGELFTVTWQIPADDSDEGECLWFEVETFDEYNEFLDYDERSDCSDKTFSTGFSSNGIYRVELWVRAWNDNLQQQYTDRATIFVDVGGTAGIDVSEAFPVTFESGVEPWEHPSSSASAQWTLRSGNTPSGNTGPSSAAEGSQYLYMETSNGYAYSSGTTRSLKSPLIKLNDQTVKFKYHMYGSDMGTLALRLSQGGQSHTLWSKTGQQHSSSSAAWSEASVSLAGYSGSGILFITGTAAGGYRGDMAIDQLQIGESAITYQYDALGRLIFVRDPSSDNREYCYDAAGNRTELSLDTDSPSC